MAEVVPIVHRSTTGNFTQHPLFLNAPSGVTRHYHTLAEVSFKWIGRREANVINRLGNIGYPAGLA